QATSCACSVASAAIAVNALWSGSPSLESGIGVTAEMLLEAVGDDAWAAQVAEGGSGVTFEELQAYLQRSLEWIDLKDASIRAVAPAESDADTAAQLRRMLAANEASANSVMLAYFNQGVLTGDAGGLHVSPIGAFNQEEDRVLIMDVDRELHLPYWTSTDTPPEAIVTPAPEQDGRLAGRTGGYILHGHEPDLQTSHEA